MARDGQTYFRNDLRWFAIESWVIRGHCGNLILLGTAKHNNSRLNRRSLLKWQKHKRRMESKIEQFSIAAIHGKLSKYSIRLMMSFNDFTRGTRWKTLRGRRINQSSMGVKVKARALKDFHRFTSLSSFPSFLIHLRWEAEMRLGRNYP